MPAWSDRHVLCKLRLAPPGRTPEYLRPKFCEPPQDEVRRTPLPRTTRVNRGLRVCPGPPTMLAMRRSVGEVDDARLERLGVHQVQPRLLLPFLEKPFAASNHYRMDHQLQLVDYAVVQERADQRAASGDHDVPALPLLELRYLIGNVLADERGVLPLQWLLEGRRDHVLFHGVHLSGHRVLLGILPGPEGGPLLIVHPSHQHGVRGGEALPYRLAHLLIEVGEVPLIGGLHHAV